MTLTKADLAAKEVKRNLGSELLQAVQEMKKGKARGMTRGESSASVESSTETLLKMEVAPSKHDSESVGSSKRGKP